MTAALIVMAVLIPAASPSSALPFSAAAAPVQIEFYQEGNRLYQSGDYQGALASYLRIVDAGLESGELFYNIGNAYFKMGDLAHAILYYERASRLLPADEDVRANLRLARSLTADDIEPLPRFWLLGLWHWWVALLPRSLLITLVAASYLVGVGGLMGVILKRGSRLAAWGGRVAAGAGVVLLILGLNLAIRELEIGQPEEAVVMATRVDVMSAPVDDQTLTLFTVHEGTTVRVDRRAEEWAEVVLQDGRVGWVRVGVLETI